MFAIRHFIVAFALVGMLGTLASATLVRETFDTDVAGEVGFDATYPTADFSAPAGGSVAVTGGQLVMTGDGGNDSQRTTLTDTPLAGTHRVRTLVGANTSDGSWNTGLTIGGNDLVFHPGFPGGGAFRVTGAGGFGNQNMGFVPPNGVLHMMTVDIDGSTGQFDIHVVDGSNPSNVFTRSFTNPASVDGLVSALRNGPNGTAPNDSIHDNLTVVAGDTLFFEGFDLDVNNATQFGNAYFDFNQNVGGGKTLDVVGGVARLGGDSSNATFQIANPAPAETLLISADIGSTLSDGSHNVGLQIGDNNIVFHPGFPGGGALRVGGPNGFGNTNMGFIPANGVLHHLEVLVDPNTGLFTITFTDGLDPLNTFTTSFTNLGSIGGDIGFRQEGPLTGEFGLFDNFRIERISPVVPEPTSVTLLGLAGLAMLRRRRAA